MRDVTLDISSIGLSVGDIISLQLVDSMGNSYNGSVEESITLQSATFTKSLLENEAIEALTYYKLTLPNGIYYNFQLHLDSESTAPHDLYPLLKFGCIASVFSTETNKLDNDFVKKLDIYFSGREAHFSVRQQDVVTLYEYYADNIINTTSTIDIIRKIDEYLSTLKKGDIQ